MRLRHVAVGTLLSLAACSSGGENPNLVGRFVSFDVVDAGHGYANFTVTNTGTKTETATCTVEVTNDFGDIGFDILVGENVAPGETKRLRMALTVTNNGASKGDSGEVKDC